MAHRFPRLLFFVVMCLLHLAVAAAVHFGKIPTRRRAQIFHFWSRFALAATGTATTVVGTAPVDGVLVANHLSYLDILVLSATMPVVFIAKKEVGAYPLIGQAALLAGTIMLDRDKSFTRQDVAGAMDDALLAGACVAFFPEGTTTNGAELLRFHGALFAAPIRLQKTVHTAAIRYQVAGGGDAGELVSFWKNHVMLPHLLRLLMLPGVEATLRFGESSVPGAGLQPAASRAAAERAETTVRGMLVAMGSLPS